MGAVADREGRGSKLPFQGSSLNPSTELSRGGDDVIRGKSSLVGEGAPLGCQSSAPGMLGDSGGVLPSEHLSPAPTEASGPLSLGVHLWESRAYPFPENIPPCPRHHPWAHLPSPVVSQETQSTPRSGASLGANDDHSTYGEVKDPHSPCLWAERCVRSVWLSGRG